MEIQQQVELRDAEQTVKEMFGVIKKYSSDVAPYASMSPEAFYHLVRKIPYKADPRGNEFLQRPWATLSGASPWGDCDDFAILLGSYAVQKGIRYRLAIGGSKAYRNLNTGKLVVPFHHVWPEFEVLGMWKPFDATYSRYSPYIHNQKYLRIQYFYPPA